MRAALLQMPAARLKLLISEVHLLYLLLIIPSGIAQRCVVAIHTQGHTGNGSPALLQTMFPLLSFSRIVAVVHAVCALAVGVGRRRRMQSWGRRGTGAGDIFTHPRAQPACLPNLSVAARSRGGVSTGGVGLGVGVGLLRYLGGSRLWSAFVTLSASRFPFSTWGGACRRGSFVVAPHHHLSSIVSSHPCSNNSVLLEPRCLRWELHEQSHFVQQCCPSCLSQGEQAW